MNNCVICGDLAASEDVEPDGNSHQTRAAFLVRILLELGDEFDEFLSTNKLLEWWFTCEQCQKSIDESFKAYEQLVEVLEVLREKQKEFVNKLKSIQGQSKNESGSPRRQSGRRTTTKTDEFAKIFQRKVNCRDWNSYTFFKIPGLSSLEVVKDEVPSEDEERCANVIPFEWAENVIKNEDGCYNDNVFTKQCFVEGCPLNSNQVDISTTEDPSSSSNIEKELESQDREGTTTASKSSPMRERKRDLAKTITKKYHKHRRQPYVLPDLQLNPSTNKFHCTSCDFKSVWSCSVRVHYRRIHLKEFLLAKKERLEDNDARPTELHKWHRSAEKDSDLHDHEEAEEGSSLKNTEEEDSKSSDPDYFLPSKKRRKQLTSVKAGRKPLVLPDLQPNPLTGKFHCPSCDYTSAYTGNVRNHYRTHHLNEFGVKDKKEKSVKPKTKPYVPRPRHKPLILPDLKRDPCTRRYHCPSCELSSVKSSNVRLHYKRRHLKGPKPKPTKEEKLKKRRGRLANVLQDLEMNPSTNKFHCPSCNYSSKLSYHARDHYKRIHLDATTDDSQQLGNGSLTVEQPGNYDYRTRLFPNLILPNLERDPVTNKFSCPSCEYSNKNRGVVRSHHKRDHLGKRFVCTWLECGRSFASKANLDGHIDRHNGTPRFQCSECPLAFYTNNPLVRHRQIEHEGGRQKKQFVCDQCGDAFSNRDYLHKHVSIIHIRRKQVVCDICGETPKNINTHKAEAHGIRSTRSKESGISPGQWGQKHVICEFCGKRLQKQNLKFHMRNEHQDKSFTSKWTCTECDCIFPTQNQRDVHMYSKHKIGTPIKPKSITDCKFLCDVTGCRKRFKHEAQYITHMDEIHGPDRNKPGPFECKYCGKRFFWKEKHKYHELTHENAETKPFSCDTCGKRFSTNVNLRYHLVNTHKLKLESRRGRRPN